MNRGFLNSLVVSTTGGSVSRKRKTTEDSESMPPPPGFPTRQPHVPLTLLHLGQPGPSSLSQHQPQPLLPQFDTVLRLSVVPPPHTLLAEQGGGDTDDMDLMSRPIKSFTSLLNGDGFKVDAPPPANPDLHKDLIDHALKRNNDGVREILKEMCTAVEETAAKKMKKMEEETDRLRVRNAELENMVTIYRNQAMNMEDMLKSLEQTNATLSAALEETACRTTSGNGVPTQQAAGEEEAESSSLDPDQVVVVRITCKGCWRGPAVMMTWPCRHLCLCKACERSNNRCPICNYVIRNSVEVKFY